MSIRKYFDKYLKFEKEFRTQHQYDNLYPDEEMRKRVQVLPTTDTEDFRIYINNTSEEVFAGYYHAAVFDLSYPVLDILYFSKTNHLFLLVDKKDSSEDILISSLVKNPNEYFYIPEQPDKSMMDTFLNRKASYKEYLKQIEIVIDQKLSDIPSCNQFFEFHNAKRDELLQYKFNPNEFSDEAVFCRKYIQACENEKDVLLKIGDVADVICDRLYYSLELDYEAVVSALKGDDYEKIEKDYVKLLENIEKDSQKSIPNYEDEAEFIKRNGDIIKVKMKICNWREDNWELVVPDDEDFRLFRYRIDFNTTRDFFNCQAIPRIKSFFENLIKTHNPSSAKENQAPGFLGIHFIRQFYNDNHELQDCGNQIEPNDIVFNKNNLSATIITEKNNPDFTDEKEFIIRCKKVDAEFVAEYLNSNIVQRYIKHEKKVQQDIFNHITTIINNLLIPVRKEDSISSYRKLLWFNSIGADPLDTYLPKPEQTDTLESLLNYDRFEQIISKKHEKIKKILAADFKELKACFTVEAYKSVLILSGSIMETILIDWLSEKHGKNYFDEPFIINGKHAALVDYINAIDEIETPCWMEKGKAHTIREKRNLVHAKLCLKSENAINKKTCEMVMSYLNEILESYWESLNSILNHD